MTPAEYGRLDPLTPAQLAAVVDGLRARGLVDGAGLTAAGRETKAHIESVTDALAAPAYDCLERAEVHQLTADLEPLAARIAAVGY
jgi:hypothetical protein